MIFKPVRSPRMRMVCCSYAGGSASAYSRWHTLLPADVEVCAVELPGRGARFREAPLFTMAEIVDEVMSGLANPVGVDLIVYGHSMGGVVALELTKHLFDVGTPPRSLVVSGCSAPHLPSRRQRRLHDLPRDELVRELNLLEGLPRDLPNAEAFIDMFLPTIRADLQSHEEWRSPIRELPVPIHVLGGRDDALVWATDLAEWQRYSSVPVCTRMFDGGHFFIKSHREEVLAHLTAIVDGLKADTHRRAGVASV
ncbi:thioesterase [Trinickia fusca]|uniref:Thioesterase n=2 Tax=Trinickia fusca TaxID=2419777 RepID=A0A494XBM7_9BURK|nr:thioesterase [Trinickia fusca]